MARPYAFEYIGSARYEIRLPLNLRSGLGCGSTEFYVVRPNGAVLPDYLHPFLRPQSYRASARAAMIGAVGQLRVPKHFVENTIVPVSPLNEQRRIVAKIQALVARSGRAKEAPDAIPALLDRLPPIRPCRRLARRPDRRLARTARRY